MRRMHLQAESLHEVVRSGFLGRRAIYGGRSRPEALARIVRIAPRCRGSRPLPRPVVAPAGHLQRITCVCAALVHPAALGGRRDLAVVRQVHLACV